MSWQLFGERLARETSAAAAAAQLQDDWDSLVHLVQYMARGRNELLCKQAHTARQLRQLIHDWRHKAEAMEGTGAVGGWAALRACADELAGALGELDDPEP